MPITLPGVTVIIVMGASGAGKTTIGARLAEALGIPFQDADPLHPVVNIRKMAAGHELNDADRAPWLAALRAWVEDHLRTGTPAVLAASLLRRAYRDQVIAGDRRILLVHLRAAPAVLHARMLHRIGHFMPATLLDSQLAALEEPTPAEHAVSIDVQTTPEHTIAAILHAAQESRPT